MIDQLILFKQKIDFLSVHSDGVETDRGAIFSKSFSITIKIDLDNNERYNENILIKAKKSF